MNWIYLLLLILLSPALVLFVLGFLVSLRKAKLASLDKKE